MPTNEQLPEPSRPRRLKTMPGPKGRFLLGNLPDIPFEQFHLYLKEHSAQYGDAYKLTMAHKTMVVLSHPDTVRSLLKKRPNEFRRVSAMQQKMMAVGI